GYPSDKPGHLLIYPQIPTKYVAVQKAPFANLFAAFRSALTDPSPGTLVICGYSLSDEHIYDEIERAILQRGNSLTVLAFVKQPDEGELPPDQGLPPVLSRWLGNDSGEWKERMLVIGSRGIYHGSLKNHSPIEAGKHHPWWSFEGITNLLKFGPEIRV
ncbi:MAG: hypothetical protein V3T23_05300, partial [Nitrososphaerales archaeon]